MVKLSLPVITLLGALTSTVAAANCDPDAGKDLETVGKTRLSVWFWDVYDAELLTNTGNYDTYERRALRLNYLREIEAADLVDTTREEWQRLDIRLTEQHNEWLQRLNEMWPDVQEGDCLMLVETEQGHSEFFNAEGKLGTIESSVFTDDFLAIWLSPDSKFKSERNELIGANK